MPIWDSRASNSKKSPFLMSLISSRNSSIPILSQLQEMGKINKTKSLRSNIKCNCCRATFKSKVKANSLSWQGATLQPKYCQEWVTHVTVNPFYRLTLVFQYYVPFFLLCPIYSLNTNCLMDDTLLCMHQYL